MRPIKEPAMSRPRLLLAAATVAVLALTGCTGSTGGELKAEDSPLAKYLSALYTQGLSPDATQEEQQAYYNEQNRKTEELVAQCMTKEGFEYVPNTSNGTVIISDSEENPWKPDDREWVEKYGYGAVNYPGRQEMAEGQPEASEAPVDPNNEYVQSLTEAEQQAFYAALYGAPADESQAEDQNEDGSYEYHWEDAGCYGWAQHEIQGDNFWERDEYKPIIEALTTFYSDLQSSPEYAELDSEWSGCMADAGFDGFKTQAEAAQSIYDLINAYYEDMPQDDEVSDTFGTPDDPEFAQIGEQELPLALADLDCREKTDYRARQLRIQFDLEEQFIADHTEELEALKASVEQGR